ncbi:uncharacterized protein LOC123534065 isoform X1 [Mercenaria mercenaria]|uniref:uncharacterized protein LOC123534065 isoform X1 n=1 Tax=Mercenaria mercenaria TaxID=6596 RepID=UPI001E1D7A3A|nr:uncharacterized protein LOC123534065 isoform X1 [Mercenaria mercenaria]
MDNENCGCFAWIVSFRQSCNERWARFRNRLRRRFYARRGQTIDPSTIVNETGTRDMVLSKTPYKTNKVLPESLAATMAAEKERPVVVGSVPPTGRYDDFEKLVEEYVSCIVAKARESLLMETQAVPGNKNVIVENSADYISLSSSVISHIADIAVTESLSNALLESNINQSSIHRDIKELMVQMSLKLLAEKLIEDDQLTVRF